jgi:hypothetical protein
VAAAYSGKVPNTRAWGTLLVTLQNAIQIFKRGLHMRWMTWILTDISCNVT